MLNSKISVLVALGALLAIFYITVLKDWFRPAPIQIVVQNRRQLPGSVPGPPLISFKFQKDYRLTRVKVWDVHELTENEHAAPYWELLGNPESPATNFVLYGFSVLGMKVRTEALPLEPATSYRILVEAGRSSGSADFQPGVGNH